MSKIKLAGAAWSFVGTNLVEAARIWRALGVHAMDLLAIPGAPVDAQEIDRDPQGQARRFTEAGMELANLIYIFGVDFEDRAINSADPRVRQRNLYTMKNVLECCQAAQIQSLLILPGVDQPGLSHADSLALTATSLHAMDALVADDTLRSAMGSGRDGDYVDYFAAVKRAEFRAITEQVTAAEVDAYLTLV